MENLCKTALIKYRMPFNMYRMDKLTWNWGEGQYRVNDRKKEVG